MADPIELSSDDEADVSMQTAQEVKDRELPWVEKYRPASLNDIAHQDDVVSTLRRTMETANLPHLLFYGPPGTGKTSTILAVAKELYGPTLFKKRVLELNASNERGIDVVRHKIKNFAQVAVGKADNVPGFPCPPYKIIILDEADSLTQDAQAALRRTMELYTKVTRFCIICNYVSRIIEPITSRCAKFRFKPLNEESMTARLRLIAQKEGVQFHSQSTMDALVETSNGDLRKSITLMQSSARVVGEGEKLTAKLVEETAGQVPREVGERLFAACLSNDSTNIESVVDNVILDGYPVNRVLLRVQQVVIASELTDKQKGQISIKMGEVDRLLIDGADEYLQLLNLMLYASSAVSE